jgi:hypothetical protein
METTYTSTAALRDHAVRVRAAAPVALSAGRSGLSFGTVRILPAAVCMQHAVNVPFTSVDPKQDRPPRGVDR